MILDPFSLPNAWLKSKGYISKRGERGLSANNPSIALTPKEHKKVDKQQRELGLWDAEQLQKLDKVDVIELNIDILRETTNAPEKRLDELQRRVSDHAENL